MVRFERRSFGRFRGSRMNFPKPIKVGEEYDVEINEVGSKGDGIARIKNFVVFVNNTNKGDKVRIKITEVRNKFAIGEKTGESSSQSEEKKTEVKEMAEETLEETEEPSEETEEPSEEETS